MKRTLFMLLTAILLTGLSACARHGMVVGTCKSSPETCSPVQGDPCAGRGGMAAQADPIPPGGSVTYPYYSLHGPRDFLSANPRSIGP